MCEEIIPEGKKRCSKCLEIKDLEEFNLEHKKDINRRISRCKDCQYEKIEENRLKNIEINKNKIISIEGYKTCCSCKKNKPLIDFSKNKGRKDGFQTACKQCIGLAKQEHIKQNQEKNSRLSLEEIYEQLPNKTKKCCSCKKHKPGHEFYRENRAITGLTSRCKSCFDEQTNKNDPNREKRRGYVRKSDARPEAKKAKNENVKRKRKTNLHFKIKCLLSSRIFSALKQNRKSAKTVELVGCSIEFLIQHLESQFEPWMTWENHGNPKYEGELTWHIDHIIPCEFFNLECPKQQKTCFNWKNLQPLERIANSSKQDTVIIDGKPIKARKLKKKNPANNDGVDLN